jgi:hypothetical protein
MLFFSNMFVIINSIICSIFSRHATASHALVFDVHQNHHEISFFFYCFFYLFLPFLFPLSSVHNQYYCVNTLKQIAQSLTTSAPSVVVISNCARIASVQTTSPLGVHMPRIMRLLGFTEQSFPVWSIFFLVSCSFSAF